MKAHRRYVREQIKDNPRLTQDVADARAEVRIAVMIARLREARGWTQRDLAKVTGIKQPQIARIEKGGQMPILEPLGAWPTPSTPKGSSVSPVSRNQGCVTQHVENTVPNLRPTRIRW